MQGRIVVIGAGHCGGVAAVELREQGWTGEIVLISDDPNPPYQRPPLSKDYLAGRTQRERLSFKPPAFYEQKQISLALDRRVSAIDRAGAQVVFADGERLGYDGLLLATGARPRRLDLPGSGLAGVCYLRSLADSDALRDRLGAASRVVVIGGGYIGLEVASVAIEAGRQVTVLEAAPRLLARVASEQLAAFVADQHRARGVEIVCGAKVEGFEGTDGVTGVRVDGRVLAADLVVVGVGVLPNIELAAEAGLACDNGIVVDERCRTADPLIYAAGDCCNHPNPLIGRRLRLESVPNAMEQGKVAAANLCGKERTYAESPWFWSNQYDLRLQAAGLLDGCDQTVLRGSVEARAFLLFHLRAGALAAVESVNMARDFLACRKLVAQQARLSHAQLADPAVALASLG